MYLLIGLVSLGSMVVHFVRMRIHATDGTPHRSDPNMGRSRSSIGHK